MNIKYEECNKSYQRLKKKCEESCTFLRSHLSIVKISESFKNCLEYICSNLTNKNCKNLNFENFEYFDNEINDQSDIGFNLLEYASQSYDQYYDQEKNNPDLKFKQKNDKKYENASWQGSRSSGKIKSKLGDIRDLLERCVDHMNEKEDYEVLNKLKEHPSHFNSKIQPKIMKKFKGNETSIRGSNISHSRSRKSSISSIGRHKLRIDKINSPLTNIEKKSRQSSKNSSNNNEKQKTSNCIEYGLISFQKFYPDFGIFDLDVDGPAISF